MFFIFVGVYSVYDAGASFPTTTTMIVIIGGIGFVLGGIYLLVTYPVSYTHLRAHET